MSPVEFIPLLEQNGLIVQLGKWVFEQAAHQCKKWSRVKDDFHMSVNLSYRQLLDGTILDFMQATLHEINLDPSKITMELTETYLIEENSTCLLYTSTAGGVGEIGKIETPAVAIG